jgi:hypothetical protein
MDIHQARDQGHAFPRGRTPYRHFPSPRHAWFEGGKGKDYSLRLNYRRQRTRSFVRTLWVIMGLRMKILTPEMRWNGEQFDFYSVGPGLAWHIRYIV